MNNVGFKCTSRRIQTNLKMNLFAYFSKYRRSVKKLASASSFFILYLIEALTNSKNSLATFDKFLENC